MLADKLMGNPQRVSLFECSSVTSALRLDRFPSSPWLCVAVEPETLLDTLLVVCCV